MGDEYIAFVNVEKNMHNEIKTVEKQKKETTKEKKKEKLIGFKRKFFHSGLLFQKSLVKNIWMDYSKILPNIDIFNLTNGNEHQIILSTLGHLYAQGKTKVSLKNSFKK
jgi:hypothetical protein